MEKILDLFKNVKGGPMTTVVGVIMFALGGWATWTTYKSDNVIAWVSVEVGIFIVGAYLLFKSDEWLRHLFKKDGNTKS